MGRSDRHSRTGPSHQRNLGGSIPRNAQRPFSMHDTPGPNRCEKYYEFLHLNPSVPSSDSRAPSERSTPPTPATVAGNGEGKEYQFRAKAFYVSFESRGDRERSRA